MSSGPVLAVGGDDRIVVALERRGTETIGVEGVAEAAAVVRARRPLAIVLAGATATVADARRVHQAEPDVPVVIVAEPAAHGAIDTQVRIDPLVGTTTRCVPAEPLDRAIDLVVESADNEARRRSYERQLQRVRDVQLPAALSEPAVASQYLGQLLEHAMIGVIDVDADGTIRGWNPKAEAITGRRQRDAVGSSLYSMFPPAEAQRLRATLEEAGRSTEALTEVMSRRGPAGEVQHLEATAASIDDGLGELGALVLLHDVTDRVNAERELEERTRAAALGSAVGVALTSNEALDAQLQRCAEAIVAHLDAAFARIWLVDATEQNLVLRASAGMYTHLDGGHSRIRVGELKIGRIAEDRRPHLTNDVLNDPHIGDPEWARREGMVAFAGYPLVAVDRLIGVLGLFSREVLPHATLEALSSVADMIAVGVARAENRAHVVELLEREHRARAEAEDALDRYVSLARTLQQSLLPPGLPVVPGLEISARYQWAGAGDVVGGDFYDLFRLADGRVCLAIGDVSGKGVEAGAVSSLVRHTARAAARVHRDPVGVLGMLNGIVLEQTPTDRFCTVLLLTLEDSAGPVRRALVTNAGHVRPLLVRSGRTQEVGEPGVPVGLFEHIEPSESEIAVEQGDVLVLFTDGVTEARSPAGEFRPDLVHEVLRGLPGASASTITEAIEDAVVELQAGRPRDDVAVLAIRFVD